MRIQFINHSSIIIIKDDIRILCDPWIEGDVFQNGWKHLAETIFTYNDFGSITHIWFSHEHPDHFFPPNIKKIPNEIRKRITVLYQKTKDKKVLKFCQKLGFKNVIEMEQNESLDLNGVLKIKCNNIGHDSYLHVSDGTHSILNINDCDKSGMEMIRADVGDIDLLLTQFSYAQWEGNPDRKDLRIGAAKRKFEEIKYQVKILKPKYIIPFASFVYFCHEENYYCNDSINKISETCDFIIDQCSVVPIILFTNDTWSIGKPHDNTNALAKWNIQYSLLKNNELPITKTELISEEKLLESINENIIKTRKYFNMLDIFRLKPLLIYVSDLNKGIELNFLKRANFISFKENEAHISLTSETLNFCMKFNWGFNTTRVNGRLRTNGDLNGLSTLKVYEGLANMMNHNEKYDGYFKRLMNKLKGRK